MAEFLLDKNHCPSALMGFISNPIMTIIMIIASNRGQSCGLCEMSLEDQCLIFSVYGSMLLDSPSNQWDPFQQLSWSLAETPNTTLQQEKISTTVGSSAADDWIDGLKPLVPFQTENGRGKGCRHCTAHQVTTAVFSLGENFRADVFQVPVICH